MYLIKNVQSKDIVARDIRTICDVACHIRKIHPNASKGLHPFAAMKKVDGELFTLSQNEELELERHLGIATTMGSTD